MRSGDRMNKIVLAAIILAGLSARLMAEPEAPPAAAAPAAETVIAAEKAEPVGASTCLSCHEAQAPFKDSVHGRGFPQLKKIEFEKSCETCHGPGSLHAAAAGDKTNPGFATIKGVGEVEPAKLNAMCLDCHQDASRLHWKGGKHEARGLSCVSCHSVHNPGDKKTLLIGKTDAETCYQCHKDVQAQMRRNAHMPVREGKMGCSSCHKPHGSEAPKMLAAASGNQLCLECHSDKRGPFIWNHPPVLENCLNCHHPHGSHHDKMLLAKQPFLCQRCHNATRHPSTAYGAADASNKSNRIMAQSCYTCHSNIHGSNHPSGKFFLR